MNISHKKKLLIRFLLNPNSLKTLLDPNSHNSSTGFSLCSSITPSIHTFSSSSKHPFCVYRFFSALASNKSATVDKNDSFKDMGHAKMSRKKALGSVEVPNVTDNLVSRVVDVVRSGKGDCKTQLDMIGVGLSRQCVFDIFRVLNSERVSALQFFEWVRDRYPELYRNADVCSLIIDNCGWLDDFRTMFDLLNRFNEEGLCVTEKAFGFIPVVDSNKDEVMQSITSVLGVLKKVKGSCGRSGVFALIKMLCVKDAFEMAKFVMKIADRKLSYYAVLISEKCRRGCYEDACALLGEMGEVGCHPDSKVYNYLLGSLCKSNRLPEAQALLEIMVQKGVKPDAITFEVFVYHLCRLGKVDTAAQVFKRLRHMGVVPQPSTHTSLVKGYFSAGKYDEAYKHVHDLGAEQMPAANKMYSLLARLHQKKGNLDVAHRILMELMEKGLRPDYSVYMKTVNALRRAGHGHLSQDLEGSFNKFTIE